MIVYDHILGKIRHFEGFMNVYTNINVGAEILEKYDCLYGLTKGLVRFSKILVFLVVL